MRGLSLAALLVLVAAAAAIAVNIVLLGYTSPHDESVGKLSPAGGILRPLSQPTARVVVKPAYRKSHGRRARSPRQVTTTVVVTQAPPSTPSTESEHHQADD